MGAVPKYNHCVVAAHIKFKISKRSWLLIAATFVPPAPSFTKAPRRLGRAPCAAVAALSQILEHSARPRLRKPRCLRRAALLCPHLAEPLLHIALHRHLRRTVCALSLQQMCDTLEMDTLKAYLVAAPLAIHWDSLRVNCNNYVDGHPVFDMDGD